MQRVNSLSSTLFKYIYCVNNENSKAAQTVNNSKCINISFSFVFIYSSLFCSVRYLLSSSPLLNNTQEKKIEHTQKMKEIKTSSWFLLIQSERKVAEKQKKKKNFFLQNLYPNILLISSSFDSIDRSIRSCLDIQHTQIRLYFIYTKAHGRIFLFFCVYGTPVIVTYFSYRWTYIRFVSACLRMHVKQRCSTHT